MSPGAAEAALRTLGALLGSAVSALGAVKAVRALLGRRRARRLGETEEMRRALEGLREDLRRLESLVQENAEAVATLQCESLNNTFARYVEEGRPCPIPVKQAAAAMYEAYTRDSRHNHVARDYLERLMALPAK